jgi:predicted anti-sigma-YlaC factor YlaD
VLDQSLPAGHPVAAHLAACTECREEVDAMLVQNELLRSWTLTGDVPEAEPRPGFYARVLEKIEAQRPVSIWALFTESLVGRRLATASLAMALVMGAFVVAGESGGTPQAAQQMDPLYPGTFASEVMTANASGNGAVFASLVSYQGH